MSLIKINSSDYGVAIDLKYATTDNIVGQALYDCDRCYLHEDAAKALKYASHLAKRQGLYLHIFDAFRSLEAQKALWNIMPDPDYVADPKIGSAHNRGVAIDVTLADLKTATPLDMGTEFDEMSPASHHDFTDLPARLLNNRMQLKMLMIDAGFEPYASEWWHYQLPEANRYPILGKSDMPSDHS